MSEENHYVEVVETATGKVEKTMGPMSESKADRVERGLLINMNIEAFHVRTGTRAALDAEAKPVAEPDADAPGTALLAPGARAAAELLGLQAAPGFEAELEDGQGLAFLIVAEGRSGHAHHPAGLGMSLLAGMGGIGPMAAGRLHRELAPLSIEDERQRARERKAEDKAAELLAAGIEFAASPKSRTAGQRLRGAALAYGDARRALTRKPRKQKPKR